jgi:triacylglycerol esterase/lipase EstA (alpha/beta hydrolase family)
MRQLVPLAVVLTLLWGTPERASAKDGGPSSTHPLQGPPILCVPGIFDDGSVMESLARTLESRLKRPTVILELSPADGSVPMAELAQQIRQRAHELALENGGQRIDLVAFSMGALASRIYIQEQGGKDIIRTWVSISGPHRGSTWAFFHPNAGGRDMRPDSPLLRRLNADPDPWGDVRVFSFWTPWDLMVVPAESSRLPGATNQKVNVALHPLMLHDPEVAGLVVGALSQTE